jgi:hypothetical protein
MGVKLGQFLPCPTAPRQKCDLWIGEPLEWAIEIKMALWHGFGQKRGQKSPQIAHGSRAPSVPQTGPREGPPPPCAGPRL